MARNDTDARLAAIPLFEGLSKKELRLVSQLMTELTIAPGTTLIEQDTVGRECMIIVSGTAVVRRNGRKIATLGSGDIMGELSVLSGLPRTATVVADTELVIESLNRREFMSLLDDSPRIAKKILLGAITSLHELAVDPVS
jgi:CRP/FNR family transcriptional regulator, cyclic AMP receptor protein